MAYKLQGHRRLTLLDYTAHLRRTRFKTMRPAPSNATGKYLDILYGVCATRSLFVCRTKGLYPREEMYGEKRWVNQQLSRKATAQEHGCPRGSVRGMWLLLLIRWYYGCKRNILEKISVKFWWIKNSYKKSRWGRDFFAHVQTGRPPSLLYCWYRVIPGGKAGGAWCCPPTISSTEVTNR
jgi:hypothetical protein